MKDEPQEATQWLQGDGREVLTPEETQKFLETETDEETGRRSSARRGAARWARNRFFTKAGSR